MSNAKTIYDANGQPIGAYSRDTMLLDPELMAAGETLTLQGEVNGENVVFLQLMSDGEYELIDGGPKTLIASGNGFAQALGKLLNDHARRPWLDHDPIMLDAADQIGTNEAIANYRSAFRLVRDMVELLSPTGAVPDEATDPLIEAGLLSDAIAKLARPRS